MKPYALKLWVVYCEPVRENTEDYVKRQIAFLLAGPGKGDETRAMMWTALAMCGIGDNRLAQYETVNRRVLVFRTKRAAQKYCRLKAKNKSWTFTPQPIRMQPCDETDLKEYEKEIACATTWEHRKFSETHDEIIGHVFTPSEGPESYREEVVGVAPSTPFNEAERIVKSHNDEVNHLVSIITLNSWF